MAGIDLAATSPRTTLDVVGRSPASRRRLSRAALYVALGVIAVVMLVPFVWMVLT